MMGLLYYFKGLEIGTSSKFISISQKKKKKSCSFRYEITFNFGGGQLMNEMVFIFKFDLKLIFKT